MTTLPHFKWFVHWYMITEFDVIQRLRNVRGQEVKWAKLVDKLTIADHIHQTAAELYAEINDHLLLMKQVCHYLNCYLYIFATINNTTKRAIKQLCCGGCGINNTAVASK